MSPGGVRSHGGDGDSVARVSHGSCLQLSKFCEVYFDGYELKLEKKVSQVHVCCFLKER